MFSEKTSSSEVDFDAFSVHENQIELLKFVKLNTFLPASRAYLIKIYYLCADFAKQTLQKLEMEHIIKHNAMVKAIDGQRLIVTIVQSSACAGCAARTMCNSAESKQKDVEVTIPHSETYRVGQEVVLEGRLSDGRYAALIAYGLPLLLLIPVLFVVIQLTGSETQGALWALASVAVYYIVVFLFFRQRLQQRFSFEIKRPTPIHHRPRRIDNHRNHRQRGALFL